MGARAQEFADTLQQQFDVRLHRFELNASALELGEIEHIVDEAEQVFGAVPERLEIS